MHDDYQDLSLRERITLAGSDLMDYLKGLLAEARRRRLMLRKPDGVTLLETPLLAAIAVAGVLMLIAPILTALVALGALVAKVQVDIVSPGDDKD